MSNAPKDPKSIFLAALDIPDPAGRSLFVEKACDGDAVLRKRVENLLGAYDESGGPLDKLAGALAPTKLGESIREQVGSTIGPYKLMEQIGEGGFGLVFVAEQQQPIRRKVALKIIKPGMDTRDVIARFEAERQALALMDHPNIAKVLDAGTTDSGRPYFVMELVRGIPITDYCDQNQLTTRERLELFMPVCNAIQHAHLKGIIHRDVKPSNVLIMLHDDRPVVKVIDFGVAKALYQPLTEHTIYTRFAQMIGTPLYMSPEQAKMSGLDIDTRSDIYSLGVLLYELLTGTTPFNKERLAKAAYDELLKIIREEEPPKPSVRLSQSTETLPSIAAQRKTEPAKLSKMFHGDLDWIAMKALEKDRTRRYETANAFAADVSRYLNDEPVEASPPSTAYRLRKFGRKHRKAVIALAAIAGVLMIGITGTTWGLIRARRAEQAAVVAESKERTQRETAEAERNRALEAENKEREQHALADSQRDQAERQFVNGLLRPIGFSTQGIDPAELRSFVDWSAIKESALKMRVLEIALENPETALRVARRAERAIQSCVGLSPKRRGRAINLVSAKQRDRAADPRIRVAACWLALELGSADLPAWVESCNYLSESTNTSSDLFAEFVDFAITRGDAQQIAQLTLDPLVAILETSTNDDARRRLCYALRELSPRLETIQVKRAADALTGTLEKSTDRNVLSAAVDGLRALAPRLEPAFAKHAGDTLIAILEKSTDVIVLVNANSAVSALAPCLEPAQAKRAWDAVIANPNNSGNWTKPNDLVLPVDVLRALAPRLQSAQVKRAANALIGTLEKSTDRGVASDALTALAPRLEPTQAKPAWDALVAMMVKSTGDIEYEDWSKGLSAVAARLEPAQVKRAGDALIAMLDKSTDGIVLYAANSGLQALAPRLEPPQINRAWNSLIALLGRSTDSSVSVGLQALAPRLEPAQVLRAWDGVIANAKKLAEFDWPTDVIKALALRMDPTEVKRAADGVIAILGQSTNNGSLYVVCITALAPRLQPTQIKGAADAVVAILEKSTDNRSYYRAIAGLQALAPRLEPAKAKRAWGALIAILDDSTGRNVSDFDCSSVGGGLHALAPRLDPTVVQRAGDDLVASLARERDDATLGALTKALVGLAPHLEAAQSNRAGETLVRILEKSTDRQARAAVQQGLVAILPRLDSQLRVKLVLDESSDDPDVVSLAMPTSPRCLARLLSHPGCVTWKRQRLLQCFEDLVLYDRKPVLLKPDATDGKKPAGDQLPPRRFHNLHDAAAWIQQNWPDFDLDTNCPVTWRGSR
jgi:serine/threonine protein kinase